MMNGLQILPNLLVLIGLNAVAASVLKPERTLDTPTSASTAL
ncbi:hypothetical protein [Archangium primigenium]|nr:hypothetical protein [Archangium primigenium]